MRSALDDQSPRDRVVEVALPARIGAWRAPCGFPTFPTVIATDVGKRLAADDGGMFANKRWGGRSSLQNQGREQGGTATIPAAGA